MERTKTVPPRSHRAVHLYRILERFTGIETDDTTSECAAFGGEFIDDGLRMVEQPMKQNQFKFYAHTQGF